MGLGDLYNHFKNLIKQITYTKSEIDTELDTRIGDINDYINSDNNSSYLDDISDTVSDNDMRPVTSNAVYSEIESVKEDITDINDYLLWLSKTDINSLIDKDYVKGIVEELLDDSILEEEE